MRLNIFNSIFGLCVATVAVSCSNDQVIDGPRPNGGNDSDMISFMVADDYTRGGSFGNRPGSSTRSSVTTTDNIKNPDIPFAVYGDMTAESPTDRIVIFNGEPVTYTPSPDDSSKGAWKYSNLRYWFTDHEFSFVALYPQTFPGLGTPTYEHSRLAFNYTLPSDYTQATDILIAGHRRQALSTNVDQMVELSFAHIMSRLNFVAKVDPSAKNARIKIKEITIKGVASKASYAVLPADIQSGYSQTSDFATAAWTISQTPARIELNKATTDDKIVTTIDEKTNITSISLFPSTDPLLVIPQSVSSDLIVTITYSRTGKEDVTIEGRLRSAAITHNYIWSAGRSYTYTFTLGIDDYIIFDKPEIESWNEDQGGNYIVVG